MDSNQVATILMVVVGLMALVALIKGAARTFRRNWILALLLMIFMTPIWVIWAIIEALAGSPIKMKAVALPEEGLQLPLLAPSSTDIAQEAVRGRAERAREAIMASGNQQLIDNLNLMDAAGISAVPPTTSRPPIQQSSPAMTPAANEPAKEQSGWQKRQAVADQRKKDYPLLLQTLQIVGFGMLCLFAYNMWTEYKVRTSPEYAKCISASGENPTDSERDICNRMTRLELNGG